MSYLARGHAGGNGGGTHVVDRLPAGLLSPTPLSLSLSLSLFPSSPLSFLARVAHATTLARPSDETVLNICISYPVFFFLFFYKIVLYYILHRVSRKEGRQYLSKHERKY